MYELLSSLIGNRFGLLRQSNTMTVKRIVIVGLRPKVQMFIPLYHSQLQSAFKYLHPQITQLWWPGLPSCNLPRNAHKIRWCVSSCGPLARRGGPASPFKSAYQSLYSCCSGVRVKMSISAAHWSCRYSPALLLSSYVNLDLSTQQASSPLPVFSHRTFSSS